MKRWRSPGRGSAPAVRRFTIGFDDETVDQVRGLAATDGVSFSEKARQLVEWGLEVDREAKVATARSKNR